MKTKQEELRQHGLDQYALGQREGMEYFKGKVEELIGVIEEMKLREKPNFHDAMVQSTFNAIYNTRQQTCDDILLKIKDIMK